MRYEADGDLDPTFGQGGKVVLPVGLKGENAYSVKIQSDGKIVVSGYSEVGYDTVVSTLRLNADGSLDTSFGAARFTEGGNAVTVDEGVVAYDAEMHVAGNYNGALLSLSRDGGANADDVFGMSSAFSSAVEGPSSSSTGCRSARC